MSLFFALSGFGNAGINGVVTLTGATVSDTDTGETSCGYTFNTDGTIDEYDNSSTTQVSASTDWHIPNNPFHEYFIRFERTGGGSGGYSGPAMSVWLSLETVRTLNHTAAAEDSSAAVYTAEIATDAAGTNIVAGPEDYDISAVGL